jgi:hypothetical protein
LKIFFGGIFIDKHLLEESRIDYPIKIEYYKMINEDEILKQESEVYGIKIIKTEYRNTGLKTDEKLVKHVTNDEKKINKILDLLKDNTVTPISVEDIIDDLLKQKF